MKIAWFLLGTITTTILASPKIEEKIVGPAFAPGVVYTLSPQGMHVAMSCSFQKEIFVCEQKSPFENYTARGAFLREVLRENR